jgi:beta-lactamase regulating signal transducer with metallopeptidase domain
MLLWFAETALIAAALAAVAALVPRLRTLGPAARHALWLLVLIKLVTPPLVRSPWPVSVQAVLGLGASTPAAVELPPIADAGDEPSSGDWPVSEVETIPATATATAGWVQALRAVDRTVLTRWALGTWLAVTAALAVGQGLRIVGFRRKLRHAVPAPRWMVEEAERVASLIGVRAPEALVVPGLSVPMLWCLGRSKLLLPAHLVESLGAERWRGVLAHELAHLRRGDPWVRRLELVAGLTWWWNPVYLLARHRLNIEAELACDAWVVSTLPGDRFVYAETMFEICASLATPPARPPSPALGVSGAGRFFERRLTMILRDHVPCHLSLTGLLGTGLLGLIAFPAWSAPDPPAPAAPESAVTRAALTYLALVGDDDADDDEDGARDLAKVQAERAARDAARTAREAARVERQAKQAEAQALRAAERAKGKKPTDSADKAETSKGGLANKRELIRKLSLDLTGKAPTPAEVEEFLADDSPRATPKLVERLLAKAKKPSEPGKIVEYPDAERWRKLSEQRIKRSGPAFEKSMEEMGRKLEKEMTEKFGPGSDFEKKMKAMGKEMAEKLGPGSEFEAKMKEIGKLVDQKVKSALETSRGAEASAAKPSPDARPKPKASTRPAASTRSREARIKELESKLDQIRDELKRLKEGADDSPGR